MSYSSEKEYKVGRGRPPKEHQFKPGQSGNLKGRPKSNSALAEESLSYYMQTREVTWAGEKRRISNFHAVVASLTERALKGDLKAAELVCAHFLRPFLSQLPSPPSPSQDDASGIL